MHVVMGGVLRAVQKLDVNSFYKEHSSFDQELLMSTGLQSPDLFKFYNCFEKIDVDKGGSIDLVELLNWMNLPLTQFSRRVFGVIDKDGSGDISFEEFVCMTIQYCLLDKHALVAFAFELYAKDGSGGIETKEMIELCKDVYGEAFKQSIHAKRIIAQVHKLTSPGVRSPEFTSAKFGLFCETHPGLLYPAFKFQHCLRTSIIGSKFWKSLDLRFAKRDKGDDTELIQKLSKLEKISCRGGDNQGSESDTDAIEFIGKAKGSEARKKKLMTAAAKARPVSAFNRQAVSARERREKMLTAAIASKSMPVLPIRDHRPEGAHARRKRLLTATATVKPGL